MKPCLIFVLFSCLCSTAIAQRPTERWLATLNKVIDSTTSFDDDKLYRIQLLRQVHELAGRPALYDKYLKLYQAYSVFNYDSAYAYARKLELVSTEIGDPSLIAFSKLKVSFLQLSAGMFKEVIDSLKDLPLSLLDTVGKADYYAILARCYYDLAEYDNDVIYTPLYNKTADGYLDSSLAYYPAASFEHNYFNALKLLKGGNSEGAFAYFRVLMQNKQATSHEIAVTAATLSDYYLRKRNIDSAICLLSIAAIEDIRSSTKETSATYNLATLLYRRGDVKNASVFIRKASIDARDYGARQRMVQLSTIIPLIEGQQLNLMANEKKKISSYAITITLVTFLLIILAAMVIFQVKRLKVREKEIHQKNAVLAQIAEEKEWLLKEVHHRVKNNLQVVMSLLNTQSDYSDSAASYAVIRESRQRMYAMSLIHQKLYQSDEMTLVNMATYIPELVDFLKDSFPEGERIRFELQIASVDLDVSQAVPVGLILNELITNSIKYAFAETTGATISIRMTMKPGLVVGIVVRDNGTGLPADVETIKKGTMGVQLVETLAEQLGGDLSFRNADGLVVQLDFAQKLTAYRMQLD